MSILTENQRKQQYYPLLSVGEHEMEGKLIVQVRVADYGEEPMVTLVNGETYSWLQYKANRESWDTDGYVASDGILYEFPKQLMMRYNTNIPYPDIEDAECTINLWQTAQHMLERSQQPLLVSFLDGHFVKLNDWATEMNLVEILQNDFTNDERFKGSFRLMYEFQGKQEGYFELRDISILTADHWYEMLNGCMDLNVIVHYLDEEETALHLHQQERAKLPLHFYTPEEERKYTLEDWAYQPFYPEEYIHLGRQLQKKYPELKDYRLEMLMVLPNKKEPEDISTISQLKQKSILATDTPLEVTLLMYEI